jgi:hypothetical protein
MTYSLSLLGYLSEPFSSLSQVSFLIQAGVVAVLSGQQDSQAGKKWVGPLAVASLSASLVLQESESSVVGLQLTQLAWRP